MPPPPDFLKRLAAYETHRDSYRSGEYNEAQTRREYIDPMFKAMGWDVDNEEGLAEGWKQVVHEDSLKVAETVKAPDYSFRLGGRRLFFLEAKKPSVKLKENPDAAFQLRRYAWTAKLPVSILTNFEEFAVYDTRIKPKAGDKASVGRILYVTYDSYAESWEQIAGIFSPEAIQKGAFEKYVDSNTHKRGTTEVDDVFLAEIEEWRTLLAHNIALRNKKISELELNFAVQRIIDRIIFLRICEDRGIEEYGRLQGLQNGVNIYSRLTEIFLHADSRYNSGLFHFKAEKGRHGTPDTVTTGLTIDDKVLKDVIRRLYPPESPYEFSVLAAEILGHVYERFLGSVISLTAGGHARVEVKPEVRKAGGVYYTPSYIVDYIVKHTVGELLKDKTPQQVAGCTDNWKPAKGAHPLAILDPACGSGSFLLGAYQYLLDWHLEQYTREPAKWLKMKQPPIYTHVRAWDTNEPTTSHQPPTTVYKLTTTERKRILLANIHGVDIDMNAVEVTKLSLLLKVLEGETAQTLQTMMAFAHQRALPDLGDNIKCGNSLIGTDYYSGGDLNLFDDHDRRRINAFDWKDEFPEIMKAGGFDAVVGNPPYLGGRDWKEEGGRRYEYFVQHYKIAEYQFDIYALFWEKGIQLLCKGGLIGFITPNTWLNNQGSAKLRRYVLKNTSILNIVDYTKTRVFARASVLPIITILKKEDTHSSEVIISTPTSDGVVAVQSVPQSMWMDGDLSVININLSSREKELRDKIETMTVPLETLATVKFGIKIYETGKGSPSQKSTDAKDHVFEAERQIDETYRKYLEGKDIRPYEVHWQNRWLKYGKNLAAPRDPELFEGTRLLFRRIVGERLIGTLTDEPYVTSQLLQIVKPFNAEDARFLLGVLNSKLMAYYFRKKYNRQDKTFPEIRVYELAALPIRATVTSAETEIRRSLGEFVARMLQSCANKQLEKTEHGRMLIQRQIDAVGNEIDRLVYSLYRLTEEDVGAVEGD